MAKRPAPKRGGNKFKAPATSGLTAGLNKNRTGVPAAVKNSAKYNLPK